MDKKKLVLHNADIVTLNDKNPSAKNLLIRDDKIEAIDFELPTQINDTEDHAIIDLKGKTVIPGLSDCHVHLSHVGLGLIFPDFRGATSVTELLDGLSDALKNHPRDEVLLGWNFDENFFQEKRPPSIKELDAVSDRTPIWVSRIGMNASVFNSKAWSTVNLPLDIPTIPLGENGQVIGNIAGDANWIALARILNSLNDEVRMRSFRAAASHCASKGVTTVHAMEGCFSPKMIKRPDFACREVTCLIKNRASIDVDVVIWYQHIVDFAEDVALMEKLGLPRIAGDVFLDGVLGAAMTKGVLRAALQDPYHDDSSTKGDLLFKDDEIEDFVRLSWNAGLQFSAHAVGDRAFAQLMKAYQRAFQQKPGDGRFRIEHCTLPDCSLFELAASLGVIFSMQPAFDYYSGGPEGRYAKRVGPERAHLTNPFQDIIDAGCTIVGGSDAPVNPIDPIFGIHCMVNHHYAEQRTTPLDALKAFTINPAYSVFEESIKGTLEVGKQADMIVLSENPFSVDPSKIKDIEVDKTIRAGKFTFERSKPSR
jgi:predicted amidohydrolase YtcJ